MRERCANALDLSRGRFERQIAQMNNRRLAIILLLLAPAVAVAQGASDTAKSPWTVGGRVRVGMEYDGNVFRLPDSRLPELENPSVAQLTSGRYARMESGADNILRTRLEGVIEGPGLTGRPLRVIPALTYERYGVNSERSNVAFALELEQDLRRGRRLQLHADFVPSYFHRNYLADAFDANLDLRIQGAERIYQRGDYREFELRADYQHRLLDSKRNQPWRVYAIVGMGLSDRTYDAPFTARNHTGPTLRGRMRVEPRRTLTFTTTYDLALLSSPVRNQVILIDELLFGEDLNNNATTTDQNVRVVAPVDRSRTEHLVEQRLTMAVSNRLEVVGLVAYRWRRFLSEERFDIANRDRTDNRLALEASAEYRLRRGVRLFGGASHAVQRLNQIEDLGGEGTVDDYIRTQAHLGVRLNR
jgi:hypothetical protein